MTVFQKSAERRLDRHKQSQAPTTNTTYQQPTQMNFPQQQTQEIPTEYYYYYVD